MVSKGRNLFTTWTTPSPFESTYICRASDRARDNYLGEQKQTSTAP